MIKDEYFVLNNGVKIPKIGLGTWQITEEKDIDTALDAALSSGYTHIDTAAAYRNEQYIGKYLKDHQVKRENLWITSKLKAEKKGYEIAKEEFEGTLARLGTDYLDLYLIHAPNPWIDMPLRLKDHTAENIASFKAFIDLYHEKKIRSIGVSNFNVKDLEAIIDGTGFVPQVNQIHLAPFRPQKEIKEFCDKHGILVEAYSPLETGRLFSDKRMGELAKKYDKTIAQLALRFCLDYGTLPLPKSTNEAHIMANLDLDFTLDAEDFRYMMGDEK